MFYKKGKSGKGDDDKKGGGKSKGGKRPPPFTAADQAKALRGKSA